MSLNREIRELVAQVQKWPGWRVEEAKAGWMIYPPDKKFPGIAVHETPSDHRALKNIIGRLRRSGGPV